MSPLEISYILQIVRLWARCCSSSAPLPLLSLNLSQSLLQFSCCGGISYKDWSQNMYFNCTPLNPSRERCSVPYSCCLRTSYQVEPVKTSWGPLEPLPWSSPSPLTVPFSIPGCWVRVGGRNVSFSEHRRDMKSLGEASLLEIFREKHLLVTLLCFLAAA